MSVNAITCPSDVIISDKQYGTQFAYNDTALTNVTLTNVIFGTSGAIYYGAQNGLSAIISKEDSNGTAYWAKSYTNHRLIKGSKCLAK